MCPLEQNQSGDLGSPRGRLHLAWPGHLPTNLPPGRRVLRSVQVVQFGGRNLNIGKNQQQRKVFTRGVVEEWGESVTHLSSGPCLALQVSSSTPNLSTQFNTFSTPA